MNGYKDLFISDVVHQAFIEVSEEGTEAGGATAAVFKSRCMEEKIQFKINKPFLFYIRDLQTGFDIFVG